MIEHEENDASLSVIESNENLLGKETLILRDDHIFINFIHSCATLGTGVATLFRRAVKVRIAR